MNCPKCKSDTQIVDSRSLMEGERVRRRHKCKSCQTMFTTYEVLPGEILTLEHKRLIENVEQSAVELSSRVSVLRVALAQTEP